MAFNFPFGKGRDVESAEQQAKRALEAELKDLATEIGAYSDPHSEQGLDFYDDINFDEFDLSVYDKMKQDAVIKSALNVLKLSVLSRGFQITVDDEKNKELAEFIKLNFDQLEGNIEDYLMEMLTSLEYGYSATEKVYERRKTKQFGNKIMLKKFKTLDPNTVTIRTDSYGNVMHITQRVGAYHVEMPKEKIIWFVNNKRFGNMYGESELKACYKNWYIKDKILKFANVAYERYGTPLIIGQVQDAKNTGKMKSLLSKLNAMTSLAISGEDTITAIQPQQNVDWVAVLEYHSRSIYESMNIPSMLVASSKAIAGSYALSSNQMDVFMMKLNALQRDIKAMLEEQVIKDLIDYNFPNVDEYPKITFSPLVDKDMKVLNDTIISQITAGALLPTEPWIREALGFEPASEEVRDTLDRLVEAEITQAEALSDYYTKSNDEGAQGGQTRPTGSSALGSNAPKVGKPSKPKGTGQTKDERASVERERTTNLAEEDDDLKL